MNVFETINIDVYPWAVPTAEQRVWFDALSPAGKRAAIEAAIEEGFAGPMSESSVEDILRDLRSTDSNAP